MNKLFILFIYSVFSTLLICQTENLKKISIEEGSNEPVNQYYRYLSFPENIDNEESKILKDYVLKNCEIKSESEPAIFFELMDWVSNQWNHDGWNKAPDSLNAYQILQNVKTGVQYRCVEYGKVLKEILQAFGYFSRSVGLRSVDAAYGGAGKGHVATEVWSNNLQKWIFVDPQFSIYPELNGTPLNIYDLYELKKESKFEEINFVALKGDDKSKQERIKAYKQFINNYLGYISIGQKKEGNKYNLLLKMEAKTDHLTFQSFPNGEMLFTDNFDKVYFPINQTNVIFRYTKEEKERATKVFESIKVKTMEGFMNNMHLFAAQPDFELSFINNMPWFEKYIVILNNEVIKTDDNRCKIKLLEGDNTLIVTAVNKKGIKGIPNKFVISYK